MTFQLMQKSDSMQLEASYSRRSAILGLLFIAPVPTIGVWFAAFGSTGEMGSQIWAVAKIWMLFGPVLWWFLVQKQSIKISVPDLRGIGIAALSGAMLATIIIVSYWLLGRSNIDFSQMQSLLHTAGIDSVWKYILLVLYLTVVNSLIEEYVFRWFMYRQLSKIVAPIAAVVISGLIFTVHHTVVLAAYIPWYFNALASLGVLTGGLVWSYLYYRYGKIWPAYISHIGADIGVFVIGYDALF